MPTPFDAPLEQALREEDALALAKASTAEELQRLKTAEELIAQRHARLARSRFVVASQAMIGYVALAGFFVNAYQSYSNKQQQQRQQQEDRDRWSKEFERASQADKYRAFFEISVLATDANNPDKRLVGYALLEEFVADRDYNSKATLMLEQSLVQELAHHDEVGTGASHTSAIEAILNALAHTPDCHALAQAAGTIDRIARHRASTGHDDEADLFSLYVRRLVGRAASVCPSLKELRVVREPLVSTLVKVPELGGLKGKVALERANERVAELLRDACADEMSVSALSDCPAVFVAYAKLCSALNPKTDADERLACAVVAAAAVALPPAPAPTP